MPAALRAVACVALLASLAVNWWLWRSWRDADADLSNARESLAAYAIARNAADAALINLDAARAAAKDKERRNAQALHNLEQESPGIGDDAYFKRLARMLNERAHSAACDPPGDAAPGLPPAPDQ